jgi:hypothetical protein
MSVLAAMADGCQRVLRAPALILGLWLTYVLVPAAVGVDVRDSLLGLVDASTLDPTPAILSVLSGSRDALMHGAAITFLFGGMMDRLARDRAVASFGFFGAAGMHFFRFVRLSALAWPIYWIVLVWIYPTLPADRVVSHAALALMLLTVNVIFDYARVRIVVEDRRSAFGALAGALRFVRRHVGAAVTVVLVNAGLAAATWWLAATFDIGQTTAVYAYLLARALLRLIFMASMLSLFQARLAHAGYVARPVARWPDSPAADAVLPR